MKVNIDEKLVEEIWRYFGSMSYEKIKEITSEYENIGALLAERGDPKNRQEFENHIMTRKEDYNLNELLKEVMEYGFKNCSHYLQLLIVIKTQDKNLTLEFIKLLKNKKLNRNEDELDEIYELTKHIIETDESCNMEGGLIKALYKSIHCDGKDKKSQTLRINSLKLIIDYDRKIEKKGELIKNMQFQLTNEAFKLLLDYDRKLKKEGGLLKELKISFYDDELEKSFELLLDYDRELKKEGELLKQFMEFFEKSYYITDIFELLLDYDRELKKEGELLKQFRQFFEEISIFKLLIDYDRELKKEGELIKNFFKYVRFNDIKVDFLDMLSKYDSELSNDFELTKTLISLYDNITSESVRGLFIKWVIETDLKNNLDFNLLNTLISVIAKSFGIEEKRELKPEKISTDFKNEIIEIEYDNEYTEEIDFPEILENFKNISDSFYFKEEDIEEIYKGLFLSPRHFVILSGPPGTGKTALALFFVASGLGFKLPNQKIEVKELMDKIQEREEFRKYAILLRTKPEWTSPKDVVGYTDINGNFKKGVLFDILKNASENKDMKYFIIIDEMNLSHPEHYLSDIISAMESGGVIDTDEGPLEYHNNIYIIGTVNNDETTQNLSPRLLSRAYNIEIRVDWDLVKESEDDENIDILWEIDNELKQVGFGFGYRDISECKRFGDTDAFLKNKLIPKLRGADELKDVIEKIINICEKHNLEKTEEILNKKLEELKKRGFLS